MLGKKTGKWALGFRQPHAMYTDYVGEVVFFERINKKQLCSKAAHYYLQIWSNEIWHPIKELRYGKSTNIIAIFLYTKDLHKNPQWSQWKHNLCDITVIGTKKILMALL